MLALSIRWSAMATPSIMTAGGRDLGGPSCNTNSPFRSSDPSVTLTWCLAMLLFHDPSAAARDLAAGVLVCPHAGCGGQLRPWGHARLRHLRLGPGRVETHRPRRGRCRCCGRTQVLAWARSYPRRADTVETVAAALLAATSGVGYRRVAETVGVPATTARGWLRRARANSDVVRVDATLALYQLDPNAEALSPTGSALADMLDAVGRAVSAAIRRLGPINAAPWQLATVMLGAGILAPHPTLHWQHDN